MKISRFTLIAIVVLTVAAVIIDWPTVPVKFNIGPLKVDRVIAGPKLDLNLFGFNFHRDLDVKLGLDLQGGTDLTLKADMSDISPGKRGEALEATKEVLERRINLFGVSEPVIQT